MTENNVGKNNMSYNKFDVKYNNKYVTVVKKNILNRMLKYQLYKS